jgi:hypothetical protein
MYYMIHATDHPEAPTLMRRAYENAVQAPEPVDQLALDAATVLASSLAGNSPGWRRASGT